MWEVMVCRTAGRVLRNCMVWKSVGRRPPSLIQPAPPLPLQIGCPLPPELAKYWQRCGGTPEQLNPRSFRACLGEPFRAYPTPQQGPNPTSRQAPGTLAGPPSVSYKSAPSIPA